MARRGEDQFKESEMAEQVAVKPAEEPVVLKPLARKACKACGRDVEAFYPGGDICAPCAHKGIVWAASQAALAKGLRGGYGK